MKAWHIILAFQCFFTFMLTGLIWCIQSIHYPLFHLVDREKFCDFARQYQKRVSLVLAPFLVMECFFAILMLTVARAGECRILTFILFALLLVIWLSTFCLQIPEHTALSKEFSHKNLRKLILTNWIRTIVWSLRSILLLWLLVRM